MRQQKIVGILGGMGPFATLDFFAQVLKHTHVSRDSEHLRILLDNNVKLPSRTRSVLYDEPSPAPGMTECINNLAKIGADFVAVPCNSAHYFYKDVVPHIAIPWLNIIEITSIKIRRLRKARPLILGGFVTTNKRLYTDYLPGAVYLGDVDNGHVEAIIEEIKSTSQLSKQSRERLRAVVDRVRGAIDCLALVCTELPIVFGDESLWGLTVVNSNVEYARAVVSYANDQDMSCEE